GRKGGRGRKGGMGRKNFPSCLSCPSCPSCPSCLERSPQQLVHALGIGLSARRFHHLTHEKPERGGLAVSILRDGVGVPREDVGDERRNLRLVDRLQTFGTDDLVRRASRRKHLVEHILAERGTDRSRVDSGNQRREPLRRQL